MRTFVFLAGLICLMAASTSAYICGDANGDQAINVGDPVFAVSYVFRGGPAPEPMEAADVNIDQAVNIVDIVYLINFIFKEGPAPCPYPTGVVTGHTGCLSYDKNPGDSTYQDCIDYDYDGVGTLTLKHRNAIFNCCPTYLFAHTTLVNDTLTVTEGENLEPHGGCDCICLFDVDMMIVDLPPGEYTIHVDELYIATGEWDPREDIEFDVDLTSATSGSYCVERVGYPVTK
jgi:hypothetical protein